MELLLEIGTEEIPASFIVKALQDLKELAQRVFTSYRVSFGRVETFGTPRRICLYVDGLSERQRDEVVKTFGPPKGVAFGRDGKPTHAAQGFARNHGVKVEALKVVMTDKGEYVCVEKEVRGGCVKELLPKVLPEIINSLAFPKSMRWGESQISFARPIHWILAILNGKVVPFSYGTIESGPFTRGHPFLAPEPFEVHNFKEYKDGIKNRYVIVDPEKRKRIIREGIDMAAAEVGGRVYEDEGLVQEVTYLVENPVVIRGGFPQRFLSLPKEVLIHAMKDHQRYFSVIDGNGNLLPYFIAISNTPGRDKATIIEGNERVLKARLEDARFFFEEDRKVSLEERVEALKGVIFQSKLGTSYEKVGRFRELARFIAREVCPEKEAVVDRVAYLCKGDLLTNMVVEFPELQGIMGREYALLSGEAPEVAQGIYEHYLPAAAGDEIPAGIAGAVVGIADRLDTILGCFCVGLIPTATADPYALRRHTLGIISIVIGKKWRLSLDKLINEGLGLLKERWGKERALIKEEVKGFFYSRLYHHLRASGFSNDVVEAVLTLSGDDLADAVERIKALESFKGLSDYKPLVLTVKRVMNITKGVKPKGLHTSLLHEEAEKRLYDFYTGIKDSIESLLNQGMYSKALKELLKFKEPVDRFFDEVMVMVEDEGLKMNRLSLLLNIKELFFKIGDFSKLIVEQKEA